MVGGIEPAILHLRETPPKLLGATQTVNATHDAILLPEPRLTRSLLSGSVRVTVDR